MAGIERVPAAAEIDFEPGAEIHRGILGRHADVAEIAGAVARRNVHAAAQRDGEVGEVPANAAPLVMGIPRRSGPARVLVTEPHAVVDVIADRLNQRPSLADFAESGPCETDQAIRLAITAAEQINQDVHRQRLQRTLRRFRDHCIRFSAVPYEDVRRDRQAARRRADDVADVAEPVAIFGGVERGIEPHAIRGQQIGNARWMDAQRQDHGRRLRAVIGNLVACANLHGKPFS